MSYCSLSYVCSKEVVGQEVDDTISELTQKEQGELLTVDGDTVVEEGSMFERGMYLYIFVVCILLTINQWIC